MTGRIHSVETFGAVDGPGVRYVVFFQGCPMKCLYCHNPDTQCTDGAAELTVDKVLEKLLRNKSFYTTGGITATGGEPLMQIEFLAQLFKAASNYNIHTCLDTSGIVFCKDDINTVKLFDELIKYTNLVMLDIKHINDKKHISLTGHSNKNVLDFAKYLNEHNIPVWIRHVVVPGITTDTEDIEKLAEFLNGLNNVEKIEFLPYHSLARSKYEQLGRKYPLDGVKDADASDVEFVKSVFNRKYKK